MGSNISREKAKIHSYDTRITKLENGLKVASQEAFGQYSTIGGKSADKLSVPLLKISTQLL